MGTGDVDKQRRSLQVRVLVGSTSVLLILLNLSQHVASAEKRRTGDSICCLGGSVERCTGVYTI